MSVAVVVPRGGDCLYRERAWHWLRDQYEVRHRKWQIHEALAPAEPWSKGAAVNPAVSDIAAEIVIVADADVWTDGLTAAVQQVEAGAAWAIPHTVVHRLSETGSAAFMRSEDCEGQFDQPPYRGLPGGGIVVAPREVIHSIPLDARFTGWG